MMDIVKKYADNLFKYILCFGSTSTLIFTMQMKSLNLNTSYVLVQHDKADIGTLVHEI